MPVFNVRGGTVLTDKTRFVSIPFYSVDLAREAVLAPGNLVFPPARQNVPESH